MATVHHQALALTALVADPQPQLPGKLRAAAELIATNGAKAQPRGCGKRRYKATETDQKAEANQGSAGQTFTWTAVAWHELARQALLAEGMVAPAVAGQPWSSWPAQTQSLDQQCKPTDQHCPATDQHCPTTGVQQANSSQCSGLELELELARLGAGGSISIGS
jgi:hypothetical protein